MELILVVAMHSRGGNPAAFGEGSHRGIARVSLDHWACT